MPFPFPKFKALFAPWVLVIVGISFNIFAAIITNHFISTNNEKLRLIEGKISDIELRINTYWQNRQDVERKKDFILLYSQSGQQTKDTFVDQHIQQYMLGLMQDYQLQSELQAMSQTRPHDQQIIDIIDRVKEIIVNDIDDIYLDKLLLEKQKHPLNRDNARLMSIALFLQMLGLILVLAKDLRKDY